ncbi:MAG: ABC transporter permease [Nitrospiraceae bacterium]
MDRIGVGSLFIVVLTGIFTGMVLALQGAVQLELLWSDDRRSRLISTSVVRELGPVLAAAPMIATVGTGIASELAPRRPRNNDALRAEGTDPVHKLATTRLIACLVMIPLPHHHRRRCRDVRRMACRAALSRHRLLLIGRGPSKPSANARPSSWGLRRRCSASSSPWSAATGFLDEGRHGRGRHLHDAIDGGVVLDLDLGDDFFITKLFMAISVTGQRRPRP